MYKKILIISSIAFICFFSILCTDGNPVDNNKVPYAVILNEAENVTGTSVTLHWSKNNDEDFYSYHVYYDTTSTLDTSDIHTTYINTQNDTGYTITDLDRGRQYWFRVYVEDKSGLYSAGSNTITATTLKTNENMVLIPAKDSSFIMGSENGESNEIPVHLVSFTYDFRMDKTEVTQKDYSDLMKATYTGYTDPSWYSSSGLGDDYPAYFVKWYDAVLYCNARSKVNYLDTLYSYTSISGIPGNKCELLGLSIDLSKIGYRLPTEAEWEYACRAGTTTEYFWGSQDMDNYAWWNGNSGNTSHTVGTKQPNAFGLYDMSGNLGEWCNDWFEEYSSDSQTDPTGPNSGTLRIMRNGGSWLRDASYLRSACRRSGNPNNWSNASGFRVVCPVP